MIWLLLSLVVTTSRTANRTAWWRHHGGLDCSMQGPPSPIIPFEGCKAKCLSIPTCFGISTTTSNFSWAVHTATNCYTGHGATELVDGDGTAKNCYAMTVDECRTQCLLTQDCTAAEYDAAAGSGYCCLRANIELGKCDSGGSWDLHVLKTRESIPENQRPCRLLTDVDVGKCEGSNEGVDTYILNDLLSSPQPWWLTTNYAERTLMPRHYSCNPLTPSKTCTLRELQAMLPSVQEQGYTVVNVDWPIHASPDSLFEGFGATDYWNVDPELGTTEDWLAFVADAHSRGMKVVSDFNPSYFWTGAPAFKQATADIKEYGVNGPNLPAASPARWFRWAPDCGKESPTQPDDAHPQNGVTNGWVRSPAAGGACYYSIWGVGQPCGDLAAPAWQAELTRIIRHWIADLKLDGFMLDAPGFYLVYKGNRTDGTAANPISGLTDAVIADALHKVIVQPAHELGAAVFGETYNLGRPPINKVLDAGRSTDMPDKGNGGDNFPGFPGKLHDMVTEGNASGLEELLSLTLDVLAGWSGGAVRVEPDSRGPAPVAALKAAVTALTGAYYVVRMGPNCKSPYSSFPKPGPGDEWPGGCYGKWAGADGVAATLKAVHGSVALRPGSPRQSLPIAYGGSSVYAALRTAGSNDLVGGTVTTDGARQYRPAAEAAAAAAIVGEGGVGGGSANVGVVVAFNFHAESATVGVSLNSTSIKVPQSDVVNLIDGAAGPPILTAAQLWRFTLPGYGWAAFQVKLVG